MGSATEDKALCSLHGKMRSIKNLVDTGNGFSCAEGFQCTEGNKNVVCKFFQEGKCTKGDACGFSHEAHYPPIAGKGKGVGKNCYPPIAGKGKDAGKDWGCKGCGKDWGMPPWMLGGKGWEGWDGWDKGAAKGWGPAFGPAFPSAFAGTPYGKGGKGMDDGYGLAWGKGDGKGWGKDPWGAAAWDQSMTPWGKGCKGLAKGAKDGKQQDNEERAHCSLHGKLRSLYCLVANPDGTYHCKAEKTCQSNDSSLKNSMCKFFLKGACDRGADCSFAHSEEEIGAPVSEAALSGAAAAARSKGDQKAMCAIHNRMRSMSCLQEAGGGAFVCTPDSTCRAVAETQPFPVAAAWEPPRAVGGKGFDGKGFDGKGGSKGSKDKAAEVKGLCVVHNKWRSVSLLIELNDGQGSLACADGNECTQPAEKKAMCKFHLQGKCNKGAACVFAHNEDEIGQQIQFDDAYGQSPQVDDKASTGWGQVTPIGAKRSSEVMQY